MILYKNIDINDLESILSHGILSMDDCGNNNWDSGKRSRNATDVVYLFSPVGGENYFPEYGAIRLTVDVEAAENEMTAADVHRGRYKEYVVQNVLPKQITKIEMPKPFLKNAGVMMSYMKLSEKTRERIELTLLSMKINGEIINSWTSNIPYIFCATDGMIVTRNVPGKLKEEKIDCNWWRIF